MTNRGFSKPGCESPTRNAALDEMNPQQIADRILARNSREFRAGLKHARKLIELPRNLDYSAKSIMQIVDNLAALVAKEAPCKKGCNHCCHMATILSSWEAEQIAKYTRRKTTHVTGYQLGRRDELVARYSGVPCPFLDTGGCSIYPVRPFSCRMYFVMSPDAASCDITVKPDDIVSCFNFQPMEFVIANLFLRHGCTFADIREFFPQPETTSPAA